MRREALETMVSKLIDTPTDAVATPVGSCRACEYPHLKPRFSARGFELYTCRRCQYVQVSPVPSVAVINDIYSKEYFEKSKYRDDFASRYEQARRVALLSRAGVPAAGRVLDVGCASGDFIAAAKTQYEVWGVDISEHAVTRAKALNPENAGHIFYVDPNDFRLPEERFDAVVLWDVLEHLIDPRRSIAQAVARLKPRGTLVCSTPNIGALAAKVMRKRWAFMTPPEHLGFFTPDCLSALLSQEGLTPLFCNSRGKWANIGFLLYKLRRVMPELMPASLVDKTHRSFIGQFSVYVPTGDVMYMAASLKG